MSSSLEKPSWILVLLAFQLDRIKWTTLLEWGIAGDGWGTAELNWPLRTSVKSLNCVHLQQTHRNLVMICMTFLSLTFSLTFKYYTVEKNMNNIFQLDTTPSSPKWKKIHFSLPLPADWYELSCPSKVLPLPKAVKVIVMNQRGRKKVGILKFLRSICGGTWEGVFKTWI